MRTTVDLPPSVHRRVKELADERGQSLSSMVAELTVQGLAGLGEPVTVSTDQRSGFPVLRIGRRVTSQDVADLLDEG
jgi:predicted transcriptional regulator